ncbi:g9012 [Coccomyxa viridis]|uniref:G9012 protein n=1 Tax=Coccomyxa viridis TaxID=1274662 RepID=A0ABP1G1U2_9CHLO
MSVSNADVEAGAHGVCLGRLLESAREEAEKLESAIGIVKIELSKAPDSSQLGQLLLEQHAGLWELRKMKEKQIGKLLDSIAAKPQPQASSGAKEAPTQKYPQFTGQGLSDDDPCSSLGLYDSDINKAFTYPDVSQTTSGAPAWPSPSPWLSSGHHDKPPTLPPSPRQETSKYPQVSLRPSPEGAGFNTDGQRVVPKASKWQRPSWLPSKHRDSPETMATFNEAYGEHLSKRPPGT